MYKRILSLLLALMLIPGIVGAYAEEENMQENETVEETVQNELSADAVLMTVEGEAYTWGRVQEIAASLYEYGYITSDTDYYSTMEYILYTAAEKRQIHELGYDQFTDAENEKFQADAVLELEALLDEWVNYYKTGEETEEELTELRASIVSYFETMGYGAEVIAEEYKYNASFDKLVAHLEETYELDVPEEEVRAYFEEGVALDKQEYENDIEKYEMYTTYYGAESWYIPEGYRGVLQILLEVDSALLDEYLSKKDAYDAAVNGTVEETASEPVTEADVQAAYDACIASRQDTIDEIYARLENGEVFADLIPEYNIDPGMNNADMVAEGYMAHPDSLMDEPFLAAAFSEKMQKPGDVSDPSLGMYGIYIVYYLRDVESGAVELTDELYASLESALKNEKLAELYNTLIMDWAKACTVEYNAENVLAATGMEVKDGVLVLPDVTEADEEVSEQE